MTTPPERSDASSPLVTVVMACYNADESLRAALDSVLVQTVDDIEVLVIDDGSTVSPVPEDLPADPRLEVIRLPENTGYAGVTNEALRLARGEWVTFVDSDDTVPEDYLQALLATAAEHGADTVFAPIPCFRNGRRIGTQWWTPPGRSSDARAAMRAILRHEIPGNQMVLMRRPTAEAPLGQPYSDYVFQLRNLGTRPDSVVGYADRELYRYTIHPESVTGGLHESVWTLRELPDLVRDLVAETFPAEEAATLQADLERHVITQMLHKAAREKTASPLRDEVTAWCRRRISLRGALALARHGHRSEAVEWLLVTISPALHRALYQQYDRRKDARTV